MEEFTTERLILRPLIQTNPLDLYRLNDDPQVIQYTGETPFESVEQAAEFINNYDHFTQYGFGRWSLYLKNTNQFLGFCGIKKCSQTGEVDLGFRLMRRYWGQGYAKEAAIKSLEIAFDQFTLDQVVAQAMHDNIPSNALLVKLGFTYHSAFDEDGKRWLKYTLNSPITK